jgi:ankyrin repeat protein
LLIPKTGVDIFKYYYLITPISTIEVTKMNKLIDAVEKNDLGKVKKLLTQRTNINRRDKEGDTLFFYAKSAEMVQLLAEHGASVNILSRDGYSPLHVARSVEVAEALVLAGANINALDPDGMTPLHFGLTEGAAPEVSIYLARAGTDVSLVDYVNRQTPLFHSTTGELARTLIDRGADINHQDRFGMTALHALDIDSSTALELIKSGADVNAIDDNGETPLFTPRLLDHDEIIKVLMQNGANPFIRNNKDCTAQEELSSNGFKEYAETIESFCQKILLSKLVEETLPRTTPAVRRI